MRNYVLEVDELNYTYPPAGNEPPFVVRLPRLRLSSGEICALTGLSGCGKSTLLECLGCIRDGFKVRRFVLGDLEVDKLKPQERHKVRQALVGFMPQQGGLIPFLTIKENLILQLEIASRSKLQGEQTQSTLESGYALLDRLEILGLIERYPHELSIGQRQRAAFCKAIIHHPLLLLVDEPTSALDPSKAAELFALMQEQAQSFQVAMLVVTHDLKLCLDYQLRRFVYAARKQEAPAFWELKS